MPKTYYDILEISRHASAEVVKAAYRGLSFKYHPDKNQSPDAEEAFRRVTRAYETLVDPARRRD